MKKHFSWAVLLVALPLLAQENPAPNPAALPGVSTSTAMTPPAVSTPTSPASPSAETVTPPAPLAPSHAGMNEVTGTVIEMDPEGRTLRISADGGYNFGFSYGSATTFSEKGHELKADDISYGDKVIVRYVGMELNAAEVERVPKN